MLPDARIPTAPADQQNTADFSNTPSEAPAEAAWTLDGLLSPAQEKDELGRLGAFRILRLLGQGGMGAVFEAEDIRLKRRVAVKIVRPDVMQRGTARDRFLREARAAARVEDPHIIPIYQIDEANGVLFIAMPLLAGESLEHRLSRDRTLAPGLAVSIALDIARGLRAAHAKGLIHRDIKPANLWLEPDPEQADAVRVKVLDFGLARAVHDDTHLTAAGGILGTPAYMSPEQAAGDAVDERTDLFSLGAVLYRMLTGALPFPGHNTMAILTALASKEPTALRTLRPDVPAELETITMSLLAKSPSSRTPTAAAAIAELTQIQDSFRAHAATQTVVDAVPIRKKPRWKWPVALAALALCAGIGLYAAFSDVLIKVKTPDGKETEVRVPPGSKVEVDEKGNVVVQLPRMMSTPGVDIAPMPRPKDPDELEFVLQDGTGYVQSIIPTSDGRTLISAGEDGQLRVWDLKTQTLVRKFSVGDPVKATALHPDGRTVAVSTRDGSLLTWDYTTGTVVRRYLEPAPGTSGCWYMSYALNGKWIVVSDFVRKAIVAMDTSTGESTILVPFHENSVRCPFSVSTAGDHLAAGGDSQPMRLLKLPGKEVVWDTTFHATNSAPCIEADLSRLTFVAPFATPLLTVERGKPLPATIRFGGANLHGMDRHGPLLAAVNGTNGCRIRVWAGDATEPVWETHNPAGTKSTQRVRFSPNGERMFTAHDDGRICALRVPPEWATKPPRSFPPLDPTWVERVKSLAVPEQFHEITAELVRRNPGLESQDVESSTDNGLLRTVAIRSDSLVDVTPLHGVPGLRGVHITGKQFARLEQLQGLKLNTLRLTQCPISDLRPIRDMPLVELFLEWTVVLDLSPLAGMKLRNVSLTGSPIRELSPLSGMPLSDTLFLHAFKDDVDLSPLKSTNLKHIVLPTACTSDLSALIETPVEHVRVIDDHFRFSPQQRASLERIRTLKRINSVSVEEYWKAIDVEPPTKK